MTLDDRNEPQPGEAERPEAPVVRAWPNPNRPHPYRWQYCLWPDVNPITPARPILSAVDMVAHLRYNRPGHTIDLSAEPPEGISR